MNQPPFRVGHGYDLHPLAEHRKLILGGVEIPHEMGLLGHSDADCLLHALADSIFGALGLPDIGHYFPDDDPANKGMDSLEILGKCTEECNRMGYSVGNVDLTVVAQEPKLAPYLGSMKESVAKALDLSTHSVGLKATTNEKLGPVGRNEAIAAFAVCLLVSGRES